MSFKISDKKQAGDEIYTKYFHRLIAVQFEQDNVKVAKKYLKSMYKELCLNISGREWQTNDEGVYIQLADLYEQPNSIIKIKHDKFITLLYAQDKFRIKDDKEKKLVDQMYGEL